MTERQPSLRTVVSAFTLHQSNSTELPMRYAPEPKTMTERWSPL